MGDLWGLGRRGYPGSSEEDRNRDAAPGESVCGGLGAARGLGVPLPREERLRSLETRVESPATLPKLFKNSWHLWGRPGKGTRPRFGREARRQDQGAAARTDFSPESRATAGNCKGY